MQAARGPSFIPRWATAASAVPQTEFGNTVPHSQTTGTVNTTYSDDTQWSIGSQKFVPNAKHSVISFGKLGIVCHYTGVNYSLQSATMVIVSPDLSFAQKANVLANSPASCQLFCKESPRSLEQQLQEHR